MNNEYPKPFSREKSERQEIKDFFDCVLPGTMKFLTDHYLVGDSYRCVWSVREYPPTTDEQCLFSGLADKNGVTLRIYHRLVEAVEQRKIIQNAMRKNKMKSLGNDVTASVEAAGRGRTARRDPQKPGMLAACVGVYRTESERPGNA